MSRIEIVWPTPTTLRVEVEQVLSWEVGLRSSVATRLWNRMPASLQGRMLQSPRMAKLIGRMAKTAVRVGRMNLTGLTPNAHRFVAGPGPIWLVANSRAAIAGTDLGEMAPLKEQASIGDLQVPQRGIFTVAGIQMRPPRRRVRAGAMAEGSCRLANCPPHLSLGDHD